MRYILENVLSTDNCMGASNPVIKAIRNVYARDSSWRFVLICGYFCCCRWSCVTVVSLGLGVFCSFFYTTFLQYCYLMFYPDLNHYIVQLRGHTHSLINSEAFFDRYRFIHSPCVEVILVLMRRSSFLYKLFPVSFCAITSDFPKLGIVLVLHKDKCRVTFICCRGQHYRLSPNCEQIDATGRSC